MARATRRVWVTRVKWETLGKYEAEPRPSGLFTLHGASLGGHMYAAVQKVNAGPVEAYMCDPAPLHGSCA
jgi:hypothetical protein